MKQNALIASAVLPLLAAAIPQWRDGGDGLGWAGPFAAFPNCATSCRPRNVDYDSSSSFCANNGALNVIDTCLDASNCSDSDKDDVKEAIAQLCVNAGSTITAAPYATYSVTSGGSAWPTAWTTNSAWVSAVSAWNDGNGPRPGWYGGAYGPFGPGGLRDGWGAGAWASNGSWTAGPWTVWWGTNACPPSTWTGWTQGPWTVNAPWTTWTACSAETTATRVYTATVTENGQVVQTVATSYGYGRVVEATQTASSSSSPGSTTSTDSGAKQTNFALAGSAAGALSILAGAILL